MYMAILFNLCSYCSKTCDVAHIFDILRNVA